MPEVFDRLLGLYAAGLGVVVLFLLLVGWLHLLDELINRRLMRRMGWTGLMLTGWLGTPVHEGSHVLACWLFGHRVDRVAWFQPDPVNGGLGYVQHSYDRRNAFQEIGNLFIALAPLLGAGVATLVLMKLLFPEVEIRWGRTPVEEPSATWWTTLATSVAGAAGVVADVARQIAAPARWGEWRFWLFLYLATGLASHAAPSRADYAAAVRGILWSGVLLLVGLTLASLSMGLASLVQRGLQVGLGFTAAYWVIATAVSLVGLVVVYTATGLWDLLRELFRREPGDRQRME